MRDLMCASVAAIEQVVGRHVDVERAHQLEVRQVLLRDGRDRDVGDVDFVRADQVQQQVERALERGQLDRARVPTDAGLDAARARVRRVDRHGFDRRTPYDERETIPSLARRARPCASPRGWRAFTRSCSRALTHVRVDLGRADVGVAEHLLHDAQVRAALEQVRRERVAQHVRRQLVRDAERPARRRAAGTRRPAASCARRAR